MTHAAEIAESTQDAYSFDRYGAQEWLACANLLYERGYSERGTEAALRSKWMRWAADSASAESATAADLAAFLDNPRNHATPHTAEEMADD